MTMKDPIVISACICAAMLGIVIGMWIVSLIK